jgi:glycosyltransferase involved in cell wall biosynthesis
MNKVSIIMPAFNAENYIAKSIQSVLNQTYKDFELIIINDKSTDNTMSIVNDFERKDQRIKVIDLKENQGVAQARNHGIKASTGRFIAFLDSDDLWHSDKLSKQIHFMLENNYAFSYTAYEIIDHKGMPLQQYVKVPKSRSYKQLLRGNFIGCLTVVIDKTKVRPFEMLKIGHEDYALWLSILKENNIRAYGLTEILAYYRKGQVSVSSNKNRAMKWQWNIIRNIEKKNIVYSTFLFFMYAFNAVTKVKKLKDRTL